MTWDSWVAPLALVLSLLSLILQWTRGRPRVKVRVRQAIPVREGEPGDVQLQVSVLNQRASQTEITKFWVRYPTGESAFFPGGFAQKGLPCILGPHESTLFLAPYREIARDLKDKGFSSKTRIRAFVEDGTGRTFSGTHNIDVGDWAR